MNTLFQKLMNDAARLTRDGDLRAATAAIQAALSGATPAAAGHARPQPGGFADDADVIDVESRIVPDAKPDPDTDHPPCIGTDLPFAADPVPQPQAAGTAAEPAREAPAPRPVRDQPPPARHDVDPPAAASTSGHYANRSSGRDYKLYVPPGAGAEPLPLLVMLHGCTQDPDDFAAGTGMNELAREHGFYVLYPAQSQRLNPQRCWNWFKRSHQQRGRGEAALLAEMTRDVTSRYAIDASRVYVAGLSAGGAMAAVLAAAYPEIYAAVGVHSGLAAGSASDLPGALAAMNGGAPNAAPVDHAVPTIVFHGDADATVHPANGQHVVSARVRRQATTVEVERRHGAGRRASTRRVHRAADGSVVAEHWVVHGGPHAWSGGRPAGSYTDADGPDASAEMLRFFRQHRLRPR